MLRCGRCDAGVSKFDMHCGSCDAPIEIPDTQDQLEALGISFDEAPPEPEGSSVMPVVRVVGQLGVAVVGATIASVASYIGVEWDDWKIQDNIRRGIEKSR